MFLKSASLHNICDVCVRYQSNNAGTGVERTWECFIHCNRAQSSIPHKLRSHIGAIFASQQHTHTKSKHETRRSERSRRGGEKSAGKNVLSSVWNSTVDKDLRKKGFTPTTSNLSVYAKGSGSTYCMLTLIVNVTLPIGPSQDVLQRVRQPFKHRWP